MSEFEVSHFTKQICCHSESLGGLSSTGQANHVVDVEKCNAHSFMSSDAMHQDVFSVSKCLINDCISAVSTHNETR